MIRWNKAGQGGDVQLASYDAVVLRYDGQGHLIVPAKKKPVERSRDEKAGGLGATAALGSRSVAAPTAVLPSIRLIATRYQDHPALARLDLSPKQWAAFFQAMIKVESNYTQRAVSRVGAQGLAQLMPDTAKYLRVNASDPLENLDGGARYLLEQMDSFDSLTLALAAYNAGPQAVRKYGGVPPYTETRNHITRVMAAYDRILADL
ncbi:lytic transglycosylase domain-containing protein [Pseudorhodobacter wandonensis]|uniref:lytic transglycosylase domain-containing protein n=1 Tax=Pseudorhodobacter wandonensis TaxID=1120568 RepID=UPI0018CD9629|nr:lytic transglycosylase domain-containing protein [Pseudorhodobacter wandonensis]